MIALFANVGWFFGCLFLGIIVLLAIGRAVCTAGDVWRYVRRQADDAPGWITGEERE